jgi:3-phenylpropionate/cinnamic acid dioxygenase small subunit
VAVDRLAAELEIRNLLARLAQLADSGDVEGYLALLTADVEWEMPASPAVGLPATLRRGHDEIEAGIRERTAAGLQGPGSDTMHVVTTVTVTVDAAAEEASADSSFLYYAATSTTPTVRSMGRYHDTLRRTDAGWKLARRTIRFG